MKRSVIFLFLATVLAAPAAFAGDIYNPFTRHKEMVPVTDDRYTSECGDCHFAFQPGWLPARSWSRLMDPRALIDHFGDNAELDEEDRRHIVMLLEAGAADRSPSKRAKKVLRSIEGDDAPLRITETPYIQRKHAEIPKKLIQDNPDVKSLANCDACHRHADEGIFDDDGVDIPGHGPWTGWRPFRWNTGGE
ncbi:MAG: diheme cytochrome c [Nitrospirae bacterium]|nr:diheme cytochrome c [Nitrospirota bacterium]